MLYDVEKSRKKSRVFHVISCQICHLSTERFWVEMKFETKLYLYTFIIG